MARALEIISHSEQETEALAAKLVMTFRPGDVVVLEGRLGSGKTVFVRGLASGLELDTSAVNSPSYTLVNEYPGKNPMYHFDLYRIEDSSELVEIGWDDYLQREGLIVVEWGTKAEEYLPANHLLVQFEILDEQQRKIIIEVRQDD